MVRIYGLFRDVGCAVFWPRMAACYAQGVVLANLFISRMRQSTPLQISARRFELQIQTASDTPQRACSWVVAVVIGVLIIYGFFYQIPALISSVYQVPWHAACAAKFGPSLPSLVSVSLRVRVHAYRLLVLDC